MACLVVEAAAEEGTCRGHRNRRNPYQASNLSRTSRDHRRRTRHLARGMGCQCIRCCKILAAGLAGAKGGVAKGVAREAEEMVEVGMAAEEMVAGASEVVTAVGKAEVRVAVAMVAAAEVAAKVVAVEEVARVWAGWEEARAALLILRLHNSAQNEAEQHRHSSSCAYCHQTQPHGVLAAHQTGHNSPRPRHTRHPDRILSLWQLGAPRAYKGVRHDAHRRRALPPRTMLANNLSLAQISGKIVRVVRHRSSADPLGVGTSIQARPVAAPWMRHHKRCKLGRMASQALSIAAKNA